MVARSKVAWYSSYNILVSLHIHPTLALKSALHILLVSALDLERGLSRQSPEDLLNLYNLKGANAAAQAGGLVNDLEPPAFGSSKTLEALKKDILSQKGIFSNVMMSGSGTCIYALTSRNEEGHGEKKEERFNEAVAAVKAKHPSVQYFKCQFVGKSDDVTCWYEYQP